MNSLKSRNYYPMPTSVFIEPTQDMIAKHLLFKSYKRLLKLNVRGPLHFPNYSNIF